MIARVGMGEREYKIQQKVTEARKKGAAELVRLAKARSDAGDDAAKLAINDQQVAAVMAETVNTRERSMKSSFVKKR